MVGEGFLSKEAFGIFSRNLDRRIYAIESQLGLGGGGAPAGGGGGATMHDLVGNLHHVSGLTPGHFLSALSATSFGFDTRTISTTSPLTGGGDLTANRTFGIGGLASLGTENYLVGVAAGAATWEYKQLLGTTNQVAVVHAGGSVTLSTPQDIHTSAEPTFASMILGPHAADGITYLEHKVYFDYPTNADQRTAAKITVAAVGAASGVGDFTEEDIWELVASDDSTFSSHGIGFDGSAHAFISNSTDDEILKVNISDGSVDLYYGASGTGNTKFDDPRGVCSDGTYVYIVDSGNNRLKKHNVSDMAYVAKIGSSGTGVGKFSTPQGCCYDNDVVYVCDWGNKRIVKIKASDMTWIDSFSANGGGDSGSVPSRICCDGTFVYVTDVQNNYIKKFKLDGTFDSKTEVLSLPTPVCGIWVYGDYVYHHDTTGGDEVVVKRKKIDLSYVREWVVTGIVPGGFVYNGYHYVTIRNNGTTATLQKHVQCEDITSYYKIELVDWIGDLVEVARFNEEGKFGVGTSTPVEKIDVVGNIRTSGYAIIGNETVNGDLTIGLTINAALNENQVIAFKGTGLVAHGITNLVETDTWADFRVNTSNGGLEINGYTAGSIGLGLYSFYTDSNTTLGTGGFAPVTVYAAKKTGADWGIVGATDNVFCVRPYITGAVWSSVFIVNASGNAWLPGKLQANQLQSNIAIGTAPLAVTSTTVVTNLNADFLDGNHASAFAVSAHNHDSDYISVIASPAANHFPYQTAGGELVDSTYDAADFATAAHGHAQYVSCKLSATEPPTVNDDIDTYLEGTIWVEQDADKVYICADNANGAAVWIEIGGAASGILSIPPSTCYKIKNIYLNASKHIVVVYDETPEP